MCRVRLATLKKRQDILQRCDKKGPRQQNERQRKIYQCTTYQFIPGTSYSHQGGPWDETSDGSTGNSNYGQTFEAKPASRHLRKNCFEIPFDSHAKGCPSWVAFLVNGTKGRLTSVEVNLWIHGTSDGMGRT